MPKYGPQEPYDETTMKLEILDMETFCIHCGNVYPVNELTSFTKLPCETKFALKGQAGDLCDECVEKLGIVINKGQ